MFSKMNHVVLRYPSLASYTCLTKLNIGIGSFIVIDTDIPFVTVSFGLEDNVQQFSESINSIYLDYVTVSGKFSLENCARLERLILNYVDIGDHNLQLPASIINIDLGHVTVPGGVSLDNCTMLEILKLKHTDLKDSMLKLPASITSIELDHVTVPGGVSLENCTMLQELI